MSKFPAAPSLSVAEAIGIALLVGMFTAGSSSKSSSDDNDVTGPWSALLKMILLTVGGPLITLFFGWIVLRFV